MWYKREESKCATCPLANRPKIWGEGEFRGVAFIGEAPGDTEEAKGHPFVGAGGSYFNWACKNSGVERWQHWVTNISPCKYPSNDWDSFEASEARQCCEGGLREELKWLRKKGVTTIVALGSNVAHWLGIEGAISKVRGSVYELRGFHIIPTFHPSYFQRMERKSKKDNSIKTLRVAWVNDFAKALKISQKGWEPPKENFELHPTLDRIDEFLGECREKKALLGMDIETSGLDPRRSDVVVLGIADTADHGLAIPFMGKGGKYLITNGEREHIIEELRKTFEVCPLMFQNALFDVPYLRMRGFTITLQQVKHDTLILHHTIAPEQPHTLGYIGSIYGTTPFWKAPFADRSGGIFEMDQDVLLRYNLRDCTVLHQIIPGMLEDLDKAGLRDVYEKEAIPLLAPIGQMMEKGIVINKGKLQKLKTKYKSSRAVIEKELKEKQSLPDGFNFDSPDDMRFLFYGSKPKKFEKLKELKEYDVETMSAERKKPLKKDTKKYQKLKELYEVATYTKPLVLPSDFYPRLTDSKKKASDKQAVLSMFLSINNRIDKIASFKTKKPKWEEEKKALQRTREWLEMYLEYKKLSKVISTYLSYPVKADGRVHTQFLIHGTATGRLSSKNPNVQNLPKKMKDLRTPFVPEDGNVFVSADYSNLEVRILAEVTQDEILINAFERGDNIHDINTKTLFQLAPGDDLWELGRRAAKIFMFGGISYGGSDREIYEKILTEAPKLGLTFKDYVLAHERWLAAHPAYKRWSEAVKGSARRTKRSVIFNGRSRGLYGSDRDIEKQALNTPIQGGAAVVINRATIRIYDRLKTEIPSAHLILQIHDQLISECPRERMSDVIALMVEEMEKPVEVHPGREVVFPVDVEVGESLGDLKEIE